MTFLRNIRHLFVVVHCSFETRFTKLVCDGRLMILVFFFSFPVELCSR